jgi:pentatricopeptide repeat protein
MALQVSAHSFAGEWRLALDVRRRMAAAGARPSVHVYNALIAAAERAGQFDAGLSLHAAMAADGVHPDCTTR